MATAYIALLLLLCSSQLSMIVPAHSPWPLRTSGKKRKRKEKTTPFGVNLMRSQVLYRAAQENKRNGLMQWCYMHSLPWHALRAVQPCMSAIVYCTIGCCLPANAPQYSMCEQRLLFHSSAEHCLAALIHEEAKQRMLCWLVHGQATGTERVAGVQ